VYKSCANLIQPWQKTKLKVMVIKILQTL